MDPCISVLNKELTKIIKKYTKFQLQKHSKKSIKEGSEIMKQGLVILNTLKHHTNSLEIILNECNEFMKDVIDDLSYPQPPEDFVFSTSKGMLSYVGREYLEDKLEERKEKVSIPEKILIPEIGYYMNLNSVDDITKIPPMFYYYNNVNDKVNTPGIYCCVIPDVYVKIPFPDIIDSTKEYSRVRSIKCKYLDSKKCNEQCNRLANAYNSQLRTCNFAHKGEKIVKIGYSSRCSIIPRFGNPSTLIADIKAIGLGEIKNILLYGLNDLISSAIWFDCNSKQGGKKIYFDIDNA